MYATALFQCDNIKRHIKFIYNNGQREQIYALVASDTCISLAVLLVESHTLPEIRRVHFLKGLGLVTKARHLCSRMHVSSLLCKETSLNQVFYHWQTNIWYYAIKIGNYALTSKQKFKSAHDRISCLPMGLDGGGKKSS